MHIANWLSLTTAEQVMVRDIKALHPDDSLASAAAMLLRMQVSGAPVVSDDGVCVGVLSVNDLVAAEGKIAAEFERVAESTFWQSHLVLPARIYDAKLAEVAEQLPPAAEQPVHRFMTTDLVSVLPTASLADISQKMVDAHIHRVLVMNGNQQLMGIVSTTDILAALLRATRSPAAV